MPKVFGTIVPRNEHDYFAARHSTRRFGGTTLSAAILGVAFASAAAPVGAETSGQEGGRLSALTNGARTVVGWGHAGVRHVWDNAPTKENAIPYFAGAIAGGGVSIAKHMAVRALGSNHPYVTGAASVPVLHYVVDPLINTALSYGEAPAAFHEGFAVGQSAVAFGSLAVDLYAAAGAVKQVLQSAPQRPDPQDYARALNKLAAEKVGLASAESRYEAAQRVEAVMYGGGGGSRVADATLVLDNARNAVKAAEQDFSPLHQKNLAVDAWEQRVTPATAMSTFPADAHGIARTETGYAGLWWAAGKAVSVPLEWMGIWAAQENVEDESDKEAKLPGGPSGTSQPPSASTMPTLLAQDAAKDGEAATVAGGENLDQGGPQKAYDGTDPDASDLSAEGDNPAPKHEGPRVSERTAGDQSAMKDRDSGIEEQKVKAQQSEERQSEALLTEERSAEKGPAEEQTGAKQVTEGPTDDEQSETPQAEAAEILEQPEAPVVTLEASPPVHQTAIRPAAGSYNSNAWAANTMFQMNLSDRLNSYYKDESGPDTGNAWIRYSGSSIRQRDDSDQLYTKGDKNAVMMGVDMFMPSSSRRDRFTMGVMGGYGHYTGRTHSDSFDYASVGRVDGYSVGLYGTYLQDVGAQQGLYVDSWLLWNRFKNNVKGGDLPRENYVSKGVTASLELGYNFNLAERNNVKYVVQPHAQAVYQNVRAHDFREADGTRVDFLNGSRVQTAVGVRAAAHISTGLTSVVTPHIEVNWLHATKGYGVRLDDAGSDMNGGRNAGQLKLGVQGDLNRHVSLNIELFHNQGNGGYRETGGNLVAKYRY